MLTVRGLTCERNERVLFRDLNVELAAGGLLRIRGPNGSGKTTLLRILCGLFEDFTGEVEWADDTRFVFAGHRPGINGALSAAENLAFLVGLAGDATGSRVVDQALAAVGLAGYEDTPASALSEGQRKRVNLARLAFVSPRAPVANRASIGGDDAAGPDVWVLDEPLASLDADGVHWVERQIGAHLDAGGAVLFTSHQDLQGRLPSQTLDLGL
jgi:heme exporter protein A